MIDITFKLGGSSGTSYADKLSTYNVTHVAEYGETFTALDGTEYGIPAYRPVITFSLVPLTEAESNALYNLLKTSSVSVYYRDPNTNTTRTASCRVASDIERTFALKSSDGSRRYLGGEIVLRQRTVL